MKGEDESLPTRCPHQLREKKPSFRLRWMCYPISRNKTNMKKYCERKCQ